MRRLLAILALTGLGGCGSDFESSPGPGGSKDAGSEASLGGTGGGGTGGSSGTGGAPNDSGACPTTHRCVPPAPAEWSGPFAQSTKGVCSGEWGDTKLTIYADLNAPAPECDCTCTPKPSCPDHLSWLNYTVLSCTPPNPTSSPLSVGECKVVNGLPSHGVQLAAATPGCTTKVTEAIPPATWSSTHALCDGASEGGSCTTSGERCLPGNGGALCIYHADDMECPSGYAQKLTYYSGVDDTRDCPTSCPCTGSGSVTCESILNSFASTDCTGGTIDQATVVSGSNVECVVGATVKAGALTPKLLGACTNEPAAPMGTASPTGPITVCCTQ